MALNFLQLRPSYIILAVGLITDVWAAEIELDLIKSLLRYSLNFKLEREHKRRGNRSKNMFIELGVNSP